MHETVETTAFVGLDRNGLAALHARIAPHFRRREARERVRRYLQGLLGHIERKNGWQLAEALGEGGPQGMQRLLNAADWDAEAGRAVLGPYVLEPVGEEDSGVRVFEARGVVQTGRTSGRGG